MSDLVPFGKHKGKPVDALLDDRPYLEWLLSQSWAKEKLGNIYNIVINNGQEPTETPEHNAMQIRFLEEEYRMRFAVAAHGPGVFAFATNRAIQAWTQEVQRLRDQIIADFESDKMPAYLEALAEYPQKLKNNEAEKANCHDCRVGHVWCHKAPSEPSKPVHVLPDTKIVGLQSGGEQTRRLVICSKPAFEVDGVDVQFNLSAGFHALPYRLPTHRRDRHSCTIEVETPRSVYERSFKIEIKPCLGDDYPAILRQVKRNKSDYLFLRTYAGIGATREQFIQFFQSQGVTVVFESDVDAVQLPGFDREIVQQ